MDVNFLKNIFPEIKSWKRLAPLRRPPFVIKQFMDNMLFLCCLLILLCGCQIKCTVATTMVGSGCDWTGSGLSTEYEGEHPGITPVYLRCTAGHVTWMYPRGALRVLLRLPAGSNQDFRACIKFHGDKNSARVFLEGPRSLHRLDSGVANSNAIRCFQSKNGQAALYVEAIQQQGVEKRVVEIKYDLQTLPTNSYDPTEECRPCSGDELVHAFCTSDLVTRGIIKTVEDVDDLETSQLHVKVTKLIRHAAEDSTENVIEDVVDEVIHHPARRSKTVSIMVAKHCGVSHGGGEFVFMARRKLGDLTIKCAPRLEDWLDTVRTMREQGRDQCILHS